MNCATTISARAAHRLEDRVGVIAESVIDQFLQSFVESTIAELHSGIGYTFRMTTTDQPIRVKPAVRPPRELVSSPSFLLKRLGFEVKERVHDGYEAAGASPFHFTVLAVLDEGARETQATIADALGYDRSYLVGLLDDLEKRELIERKRDPADRRRHLVKLTPAGRKTLAKLRALQASIDDDFFAPLGVDERAQLHALLHRLASYHDPRFGNGHS